jgi:hypothetical protein
MYVYSNVCSDTPSNPAYRRETRNFHRVLHLLLKYMKHDLYEVHRMVRECLPCATTPCLHWGLSAPSRTCLLHHPFRNPEAVAALDNR